MALSPDREFNRNDDVRSVIAGPRRLRRSRRMRGGVTRITTTAINTGNQAFSDAVSFVANTTLTQDGRHLSRARSRRRGGEHRKLAVNAPQCYRHFFRQRLR